MKVKHLLIGATVTALLATSAVGVAAQPEPEEPRLYFTAEIEHDFSVDPELSNPSWQSGTFTEPCLPTGERMDSAVDDLYFGSKLEATDPRISGVLDMVWSQTACWHEQGWPLAFAVDATWRITNDGGSWIGNGPGFISLEANDPDRPHDGFMATLTGDGEYEGLTAVVIRRREPRPNSEPPWADFLQGIIVPAQIPPTSDFEGSEIARAWMVENLVDVHEGGHDGDDGFGGPPAQGVGIVLDEVVGLIAGELGGELEGGAESPPETIADWIEWSIEDEGAEGQEWAARMTAALDAIGVAPEDATAHYGWLGREGEGDDFFAAFSLSAMQFPGADQAALKEWFHPDNQDGPQYDTERPAGTVAEELQIGEHVVSAVYIDGAPSYVLVEGEVVLEVAGDEGPGSYPDEAAVQAFFEALPNLAEVDWDELESME